MKVILFLYFFILANTLFAQDSFITISGRVTDIEDQTPLPFASIGLKGTSLGTITNTQGEFDFHIPAGLKDGTMVISMLGYKDLAESVQNLDPDNLNSFNLSKEATMLREVVILDSLAGGEILQIALNSIEKNYPMKPYSMDGFYRDLKKVNGKYISVLEAAVNIYDKDYSLPRNPVKLKERVSLVEVRKSLNYEIEFNKYFDQYNLLEELLLENNVKYRSFTDNPLFFQNISREGKNSMGGRTLYELKLSGDHGYFLHLFIDTETYGIHKMIYRYGDGTIALQEINRSGKRVEKIMKMEKVIEFKEFEGTSILKEANPNELKKKLPEIEGQIKKLGAINMKALERFGELKKEVDSVKEKTDKLEEERKAVLDLIDKIELKKINVFMECFDKVSKKFSDIYYHFFKGKGKLSLSDPQNPTEGGLLIEAKYNEDKLKSIDALSGGEKSLTALSFIFAIKSYNPAPFYIFDEADAALDKENSLKLGKMIREISKKSQFISITHNDSIIKEADQIIGVALNQQKSSVIGLRLKGKTVA